MKIIIAILAIICLTSFKADAPKEKIYTFTDGQGAMLWQVLEVAKKTIPASDVISAKEASATLMAIDSLQKVIYKQYSDTLKK